MHRVPKYLFAFFLVAVIAAGIARADIYTTATDLTNQTGYIYRTTDSGTTIFSQGFFEDPQGIAISNTGKIYVEDNSLGGLYSVDNAGHGTLVASFNTSYESGLAVDNNGTVYACDVTSGVTSILRFDSSGNQLTPWTSAPFSGTSAMAYSPLNGGRLYVTNYQDVNIGYFDSTGDYHIYINLATEWPDGFSPTGLAVDALGNLYTGGGDIDQGQILEIDTALNVTSYVDQDLSGVMGLAWTGSALAIADQACSCGPTNGIKLSDGSGGATTLYDLGEDISPSFVAVSPVPEPSTLILLLGGIAGVALLRRKSAKA